MPQFVAGFAAFFTGAAVTGAVATLGFLTAVVTFNAALGAIARKLTSKKGGEETGRTQPREVTVRATEAYDVFVYGRALVGGVTVYHNGIPDANGFNNRMHHVVKWVGHECTSIELFRLDDRTLSPDDGIDWNPRSYTGTGIVQTGEFRGVSIASGPTYMRWYLGNQNSADARLNEQADEWTNSHVGHAQTYGVLEIWQVDEGNQTSNVYQTGFPNNIAGLIHGKKIYDHRRYALNRDPELRQTNSWWFCPDNIVSSVAPGLANGWEEVDGIGGPSDHGVTLTDDDDSSERLYSELIPVDTSSSYTVFATLRRTEGDRVTFLQANWFTDSGSRISTDNVLNGVLLPEVWSSHFEPVTAPNSARFVRVGLFGIQNVGSLETTIQAQDMGVYLGTGSRHIPNVSSTWEYSESPPFCVADYLTDERLGYGKRLRIPVNPSRYAINGDPNFRRLNTLESGLYWRDASTGSGSISSFASLTTVTGAPVGRRALVVAASAGTVAEGHHFNSDRMPVDPSGHYTAFLQARQDGDHAASIVIQWFTDAIFTAGFTDIVSDGNTLPSVWSQFVVSAGSGTGNTIPSSARFAQLRSVCVRSIAGAGNTQQYFQDFRLMVGTTDRRFIEPHEQIFWPSVSSAASYTDAIVATPSGDQVRFSCNGAGHTGKGHRQNVRDLLSSFNGRAVYVQSGFHITAGWNEPTKTLNKSDFRKGGMKIRAKAELPDRYNHVRGTFYDPDNEFKRVPAATVTADEYIARDSSQQLFHDVFMPFTNDWFMAQRVEFGILEQGNNQQLTEFQLKHSALDLMPGRVVAIDHDVVSWNNHTLRMVDMETDLKKGVKLFAREDYEASYVDPSTSEYSAREVTGVTSRAPLVPQVSSVALTPRDGGIQLNWNNPAARSFEYIDVFRRTTNAFSGSTLIKSTRNDEHFDPLQAGQTQFYWFRSRDFAGNVSSIFPGLTSSFSTAGLFPVARDPEYVFFEEFRYQSFSEFQQKWEHRQGSGDVTFTTDGTIGGKALQSSGFTSWISRTRIPYDPEVMYQMTVKIRQTDGVDRFYAGFTGYQADGQTPIATNSEETNLGFQHTFVRTNQVLDSLDLWTEYTGHVRGHMPWPRSGTVLRNLSQDPKLAARMHDATRYASPMFIMNLLDGGTEQIDYISVRKLIPYRTVTFDPEITAQSNWIAAPSIAGFGTSSSSVQSITNVNIEDEFSVLALNNDPVAAGVTYFISERFRPGFHPRMPSSGAYAASVMALVTSRDLANFQVTFRPGLTAYTRTGSATDFFSGDAVLNVGSFSGNPGREFGQWHNEGGTIHVRANSDFAVSPTSGPYFLVPGCQILVSPTFANSQDALNSSWIAYLSITPGNP